MLKNSHPHNDINSVNERLATAFYTHTQNIALLLGVAGIGFAAIYLLTHLGILGEPAPQLLYVSVITLLFAAVELLILILARQRKGVDANLYGSAIAGLYAVLLTLFWQGTVPVALLITVVPALTALRNGLPRKYVLVLSSIVVAAVIGIFYFNANPPVERLQNDTPGAIASIVFLVATGLLLSAITIISQNRRFQTLQSLLLTAFLIIVTISTVMTFILSAVGAYTNSQTQTFNSLEAVTTLKVNQIDSLLADSQNDIETLLADREFRANTLEALAAAASNSLIQPSLQEGARLRMVEVLGDEEEAYNEVMVLDSRGHVIISTISEREGSNFAKETFFGHGISSFYAEFGEEATFGSENLIVAAPISETGENVNQGVLILRSNAARLREIMEDTPGFSDIETYLVDGHFKPVTRIKMPVESINTKAVVDIVRNGVSGVKSVYPNYEGQQVLGYYEWYEPMKVAVIAEVPQRQVISTSLGSLASSALPALFIVAVAVTAVIISARTITDPIKILLETTRSFAAGEFSARAPVDRADEIGALAQAYNQMASQLQEMIGKLEQRVTDRTRDLEGQTLRLRVAAEIARDAASARDLHELLRQSAALISNRFGFYHTGVFLLDNAKEYAVLVASPTEAGQVMIANHHRLRVGRTGIVGRAAANGEAQVALNTGEDAQYFNNPYLPNTRSEMSLPLKVNNNVIGVLDVQSEEPEAFNEDDVAIMQILADQLATAIERARLLQEVERNLRELESAYGRFTRENWHKLSAGSLAGFKGYRFDSIRIEPISELPELADTAIKTGSMISSNGSSSGTNKEHSVALPIKLRGQTIGVISLKLREGYDNNTISVVELATERLASAMESARLYEEARLRADREQSISRVTTAISASTEYEQILQTTVREIGNILGDSDVAIQILQEPGDESQSERGEG